MKFEENKKFTKTVIDTWGDLGKKWLDKLPQLLLQLSEYWSLNDINTLENLSYNYIASAMSPQFGPCVLKISCDQQLIQNEHQVLKHFSGGGMVHVFDLYLEKNALLLQYATPGYLLNSILDDNVNDAIKHYVSVVNSIEKCSQTNTSFPNVKNWCDAIDRINSAKISHAMLSKAKILRDDLLSSGQVYLCHGDLHLDNIVAHENSFLAIDPKGIMAEKAFEVSAFDLVRQPEYLQKDKIKDRIEQLACAFDLDFHRLLAWFYLRKLISWQWSTEDNQDANETLLFAKTISSILES